MSTDIVNHPSHHESQAIVFEPIDFCQMLSFCEGNALKYIFRAGHKEGSSELTDLKKAQWYINRIYRGVEIGEKAEDKFYQLVPILWYSNSTILQEASRMSSDFESFWSILSVEVDRKIKSLEGENASQIYSV